MKSLGDKVYFVENIKFQNTLKKIRIITQNDLIQFWDKFNYYDFSIHFWIIRSKSHFRHGLDRKSSIPTSLHFY